MRYILIILVVLGIVIKNHTVNEYELEPQSFFDIVWIFFKRTFKYSFFIVGFTLINVKGLLAF